MGNELNLTEKELDEYIQALDKAEETWEKDKKKKEGEKRKMNIIFYSTHCPVCRGVEMKLKAKKIPYKECTDEEEMRKLGISSAPVLSVNGELKFGKEINDFIMGYRG